MRTLRLRLVSAIVPVVAAGVPLLAGGCKWTDFDDLEADTWVTAVEKPDNNAANWGVAITRVARSGSGGTLAVLGATDALYDELVVDPNGGHGITSELELNPRFSIGNLALEPLLLSRPDADEVALVTALEATRILVIRAVEGELTSVSVNGLAQPSAATYMVTPPRTMADEPKTQVLVAQNGDVFGAHFEPSDAPLMPMPCRLLNEPMPLPAPAPMPINIRALGAYRPPGATSDDILVLSETGKLMAYPGTVFHGCMGVPGMPDTPGTATPKPGFILDLAFPNVQTASQILVFTDQDATYALVQMHTDGGKGRLGLYRIDEDSIDEIGTARDIERLRTAALFEPGDGKRYVLAGLPTASVQDVTAGMVQVIEVSTTTGIAERPAMALADAQPEDTQVFGRSVAALPYNGKSIIAVAADNEIFLYFRTALYDETREGR